jgi:hypothetical protein
MIGVSIKAKRHQDMIWFDSCNTRQKSLAQS